MDHTGPYWEEFKDTQFRAKIAWTGSHWVNWAMLGRELGLRGKSQSQMKSEGVVKFSLGQTGACWVEI